MEPPAAIASPPAPHPHATLTSVSTPYGGVGVQLWPAGAAAGRWKRQTVQGTVRKGERGGDGYPRQRAAVPEVMLSSLFLLLQAVAVVVPVVFAAAAGVIVPSGVVFRAPLRLGWCSVLHVTGAKRRPSIQPSIGVCVRPPSKAKG